MTDGPGLQRLWEEIHRIDQQTRRLVEGDSEPLEWWIHLCERVNRGWGTRLRDEQRERIVRRIAADRSDPRRFEALAEWIGMAEEGDREPIALLPGLLDDDLATLPWSLRDRAVLTLLRAGNGDETLLAPTLAWMRNRSWRQADGLLETEQQLSLKLNKVTGLSVLLALESGDPQQVAAARTMLKAHAEHTPGVLLEVLDVGFLWLRPDVIEPLAEELARSLAITELSFQQLDAWLIEPAHSYRWQRLLFEVIRPRFGQADLDGLQHLLLRATENPRVQWLRTLLEEQIKSQSLLDPLQHDEQQTLPSW